MNPAEPQYNDTVQVFRATLLHCRHDPGEGDDPSAWEHLDDGLLVVRQGRIEALGPAPALLERLPAGTVVHDRRGRLIVPGFIDTHVHYPQLDMIAAYGEQLLEWLNRYAFPTERRFADPVHAGEVAEFFLDELLRNGTTTALVFGTVHPASVDALFEAAQERQLRLVAGKVLMDRNCPEWLRDDPDTAYRDSRALIERWHGQGRLGYAITPRFAPTSSDAQLSQAGRLAAECPDVYVHTHMAENREEVAWVAKLFPWSQGYLDVYDRFGLVRERSVYAHCIHLSETERQRMAAVGAAMAFCPGSNLFLGSGLFDLASACGHGIRVGMGTDVGAGASFSLLRTLQEGYKVAQLQGQRLSPYRALYLATLGGARALYLDDRIGNFAPGKEADFVVLDWGSTPLLDRRCAKAADFTEKLFALLTLGDDRAVAETYVMGQRLHYRPPGG